MKDELRTSLDRIVQNLRSLAERKPDTPVGAEDFNALLSRAKRAYPEMATVQEMKPIEGGANIATVLLKVSILQGAVDEDHRQRVVDKITEANERNRREHDEFNRAGGL